MTLAGHLSAAALYGAFAAAVLHAAHRAVVRLSWGAALTLALLPLCFTGRALLTGQVYGPIDLAYNANPLMPYAEQYGVDRERSRGIFRDVSAQIIPWRKAVRHAVGAGEWPLWNPFILCGDPLAGTAQPAPYYPVNALSLLVPLALAFTFGAAAQLCVAATAAFLFLRDLGCRESAALVGAAGWAFADFTAFWLEWPIGAAVALTPLVLLGVRRVVRRPGWAAALLLAGGLALTVLAGHPESVVHVVALGGVVGLAEALAAPRQRWGRIAGWTAVAGALALAVAAVYLLPFVEVLTQTAQYLYRSSAVAAALLSAGAPFGEAARHLAASVLPSVLDEAGPGAPPALLGPPVSAYAGSALWGPALYGLLRGRWRGRFVLAALGLAGACAGARMPFVFDLIGRLPLFSLSINERLVFTAALATVTLAALGIEAWWRAGEEPAAATAARAAADAARAADAAAADAARARRSFAVACTVPIPVLAAAMVWMVPRALERFSAGTIERWAAWSAAPLAAVALVAWLRALLPATAGRGRGRAAWWAVALVAVVAVERSGEIGAYYPTEPARAFFPRVPPLDALPTGAAEPWRAVGLNYQLPPNHGTMYEIEDPRAYQALTNGSFADLLPLWTMPGSHWFPIVADPTRPLLALMNVRWALAAPGLELAGWRQVAAGRGAGLWENPRALPRAFLPRVVRLGVEARAEVDEMSAETDFGRRAWIRPPGGAGAPARDWPNGRGEIAVSRRGLGLELSASMAEPGWAVVSETAWHGWRARLDGREVPLGIGDHAFLALELPAGRHHAELFYRPRSFEVGLAVSIAALALIAGITGRSLARARDGGGGRRG